MRRAACCALGLLALLVLATPEVAPAKTMKPCVKKLGDCPDQGCRGDEDLNVLKNRTDKATGPEDWTVSEILRMDVPPKEEWQVRDSLEFEGTPVRVMGYMIHAVKSGTESCNCYLTGEANNDYHLNLTVHKNDEKDESVVVELTPRFRPQGWTLDKLETLADRKAFVRVTGWLLLDTMHTAQVNWRGTPWEVHPVTKLEVCTGARGDCLKGKKWQTLEKFGE